MESPRVDLDRHAVLEASAGTGKTYQLERLVLRLLLEKQVPLEQILLVTYTEKATGELRGRLRATLRRSRFITCTSSGECGPNERSRCSATSAGERIARTRSTIARSPSGRSTGPVGSAPTLRRVPRTENALYDGKRSCCRVFYLFTRRGSHASRPPS